MPDPRPRPSNASYSGAQPARRAGAPTLAPPRGLPARQRPTRPRSAPAPPPRSPGRTSSAWARARRPRRAAAGAARGPAAARATPGTPPARHLRRGAGQALRMGVGGCWQAGCGPRPGQSARGHCSRPGWRAAAPPVLVKGTHARLEHARAWRALGGALLGLGRVGCAVGAPGARKPSSMAAPASAQAASSRQGAAKPPVVSASAPMSAGPANDPRLPTVLISAKPAHVAGRPRIKQLALHWSACHPLVSLQPRQRRAWYTQSSSGACASVWAQDNLFLASMQVHGRHAAWQANSVGQKTPAQHAHCVPEAAVVPLRNAAGQDSSGPCTDQTPICRAAAPVESCHGGTQS